MTAIDLIDTPAGVARLLADLPDGDYLAIDTEFVREKTYFPRPCLLQLARGGAVACLDLLADGVADALRAPLLDRGILKVLHSARQDLEVFHRLWGELPAPVFDTQIAGALTGLPEQCGYGQAVERLLGVTLAKGHARTDWSRRPLSAEQLSYAADDVRFLVPLYEALRDRLAEQGRADWPAEDFAALVRPELYEPAPDTAWRRVKYARQLDDPALARLVPLAAWRERVAIARDRPRRWILADDALLTLARANPTSREAVESIPGLPPAAGRRYAGELARLLTALPPDSPPPDTGPDTRMTKEETRLAKQLGRVIDECAEAAGIAPSALSPRADLRRLVRGEREVPVLDGWRRALVGERLLECLGGAGPAGPAQEPVAKGDSVSSS
jgi:ribonuclease D